MDFATHGHNTWIVCCFSLWIGVTYVTVPISACDQSCKERELQELYVKLETVSTIRMERGSSKKTLNRLRRIRGRFLSTGDAGARFLVKRLNDMTATELGLYREELTVREAQSVFITFMIDKPSFAATRQDVLFVLTDMYPQAAPNTQSDIVKAIESAFTPSFFFREDIGDLYHALLSIGAPAVPTLLELADNSHKIIRWGAADALNYYRDKAAEADSNAEEGHQSPPHIDYQASLDERRVQLTGWKQWWDETGALVQYPEFPSFLDIILLE